ncbi:PEGA domain-containing protein [Pinibacter soli]|uniref:PEGA domain-containing protein n=1 Tax=Pinibacter soli TaxID=3044211 RepID=A0ABT6RDP4_9BACT|nr:PEGA domain-containing protein [Pinibacter soli]MDI3320638.1 PEGA domain-containing protein [Pinibacter soli]
MKVKSLLPVFSMLLSLLFVNASASEKVTVTTSPQTAKIFVNGVLMGSGKITVTVPKKECVTVEIKLEGYIQETRTYCDKKGMSEPPSTDYTIAG